MQSLTAKQDLIYRTIRRYQFKLGAPPSITALEQAINLPLNQSIYLDLLALKKSHLIDIMHKNTPHVKLNKSLKLAFQLPITGKISAGNPIESLTGDQVLDLTDLMLGPNRFVLEVVGDSMSGDNICDGDYIICERRNRAVNGEIVVALINHSEVTLKRYRNNNDQTITLQPSNPAHPVQTYQEKQVTIQGVYLGLIRLA